MLGLKEQAVDGPTSAGLRVSREIYRKASQTSHEVFAEARNGRPINVESVEGAVSALVLGVAENPQVMFALTNMKAADEFRPCHSVNVAILSLSMGMKLNLQGALMHSLGFAAMLHDIGKNTIPPEILEKTEKLSANEWEVVQGHCLEGVKILSKHAGIEPLAVVVAAEHHAREDLMGYPDVHAGKAIHPMSKLVAVVDTYDAMTSDRPYGKAVLPHRAMQIIVEGAGTQFDPTFVKVFAQLAGMFPVGSAVELNTGEFGVVTRANPEDLYRPQVRLAPGGTDSPVIDLSEKSPGDSYKWSIKRAIAASERGVEVAAYF